MLDLFITEQFGNFEVNITDKILVLLQAFPGCVELFKRTQSVYGLAGKIYTFRNQMNLVEGWNL